MFDYKNSSPRSQQGSSDVGNTQRPPRKNLMVVPQELVRNYIFKDIHTWWRPIIVGRTRQMLYQPNLAVPPTFHIMIVLPSGTQDHISRRNRASQPNRLSSVLPCGYPSLGLFFNLRSIAFFRDVPMEGRPATCTVRNKRGVSTKLGYF